MFKLAFLKFIFEAKGKQSSYMYNNYTPPLIESKDPICVLFCSYSFQQMWWPATEMMLPSQLLTIGTQLVETA